MRLLIMVLTVLAGVTLATSGVVHHARVASAAGPEGYIRGEFDFTMHLECEPFPLDFRHQMTQTFFRFPDGREVSLIVDHVTLTNTVTGKSLSATWSFHTTLDGHIETTSGRLFGFAVPGSGVVGIDAGRIVYDTSSQQLIFDKGTPPNDGFGFCSVIW